MYTSGACSSVPPSAIAMVAIEPGMFLAHSVVPSSGSTAISTCGPVFSPTFSPMNSIGASSRSPSPITTVPWIGSLLSSRRIASTAAWSAAFSLPWPRSRAADTAARSVTRTISSVRMRSSNSCGGTEIWVDIAKTPLNFTAGLFGLPPIVSHLVRSGHALVFFDPYHLRPATDHLVALHRLQRAVYRVFAGGIGNQDDRHRRSFPRRAVRVNAIGMALHDRFNGNLLLRKPGRDSSGGAGEIARHQADIVAAFMALHRRLFDGAQSRHRTSERLGADAACDVGDVGDHGRCRRRSARARANQRDRRNPLAVDGHRIGDAHHLRDRGGFRYHGRMHALFDALRGPHRDPDQLDAIAEFFCGAQVFRRDRRNAFDINRALRDPGAEREAGKNCKLLGGVMTVDVERRIGLGITKALRVLQAFGERQSFLFHPGQDVVAGAVEDAVNAIDVGTGEAFAQGFDDGNRSADRRLEIQRAAMFFG